MASVLQKRLEGLMMCMVVVSQKKTLCVFGFNVFVLEISICRTSPVDLPETKVDNDELKAIVEADPSQTTSELAAGCGVSDKTVLIHLKQIGKVKKLEREISHKKTRWKENHNDVMKNQSPRSKRSLAPSSIMITTHFNAKIASPGEDISLQCAASADRPPRFVWERDAVVISSNTDTRYILGQMMSPGLGVTSQLNITRARVEDGGVYSCVAIEGETTVTHSARIDIFGPPYIRTLPPIKIQSGEALNLRCPYYGYPISKLEWESKGKKLLSSNLQHISRFRRSPADGNISKRQVYPGNEDGVLHLPKLTKEESGESYTCIVFSPSGEMARRSFEIQVVEAPVLDELRVGTGLKEGQIVQITCNIVSGDPPIYFSWLKDGKKIPPNLKITERSSELFSVLIIKKVALEHCGKYTCIATNHVGKVNQSSDLYINVAPKWLEEPTNTSLLLGQRGAVHCNANGFPQPQIHWMKRDAGLGIWRPVLDLAGGGILSYPNGTLIIEVVSLSDEGLYACNVENGVGEPLGKNLWINVNKPVHFESVGTNITTKKGLPINLTCKPLGDNPIRIKWSLDGIPIDFTSARVTISETPSSTGVQSSLHIVYSDSRDAGVYECRASNPYGVASYNVYLQVLEPPVPPVEIQISSVSSNLARISWRDPSRSPHYVVQYSAQKIFTVNYTRQNEEVTQALELHNLQPATDYQLRIASGNQVDLSPFSMPLHFTTQQEAPSSPPLGIQVQPTENPGELQLSWLPPPVDTHNGMLQGYLVKAQPRIIGDIVPTETQTKTVKVLSRTGKQGTSLSGLLKNTRYAVSISAFNSAGNGPFSLPVYQTTREGAPEQAPNSVECIGVSSTSVRVSWQTIPYTGLFGYSVFYANDDGQWQNTSSSHTEIYLQGLLKYSNYTVKVAGVSNYGMGPFSYPVICTTLQDVPGAPAAIKALMASPSSILVSWKPPDLPNGQITHYTVYCKMMSGSNPPQTYRIEATDNKQLTFLINNLQFSKQYEVRVTAHTSAGEGSSSERLHVTLHARSGPKHHHDEGKVLAGIASLGGAVSVGVGSSLLLVCQCVGNPPPRTVWYHNHNIITHHPRFTRNHDDSLLINNIDQSLSGNYTCLAKNIYGSDSVSYEVSVLPTPEPPNLRVISHKHSLHLNWDVPRNVANKHNIVYNLSWKESTGPWQETYSNKGATLQGVQEYTLEELKCGTKYSLRITASNSVGSSQPAYLEASTLGGAPIAPTSTEWFWSNATHIYIQLSGWDDNGCDVTRWQVDYRPFGGKLWKRAENTMSPDTYYTSFTITGLSPATWYQVRISSENAAGTVTAVFGYATTNEKGERIGPPSEFFDINMVVIVCSSILLLICSVTCVYILVKRHNHRRLSEEYRNSLTAEIKSERSNITVNTAQSQDARLYSAPVHMPDGKHELYEISPYAQFAIGFRTFGHVENQEAPRHLPNSDSRYHTETSFQVRSESEESDCVSRSTTLKSVPRKACRAPHHR